MFRGAAEEQATARMTQLYKFPCRVQLLVFPVPVVVVVVHRLECVDREVYDRLGTIVLEINADLCHKKRSNCQSPNWTENWAGPSFEYQIIRYTHIVWSTVHHSMWKAFHYYYPYHRHHGQPATTEMG